MELIMVIAIEYFGIAIIEELPLSVPETAGLFIFGIVLVLAVMAIRWVLRKKGDVDHSANLEKRA